jgi:hypothetical protein
MRTFNQFCEARQIEPLVAECANLMVALEIEPLVYIEQKLADDMPDLYELLAEAGFWNRMWTGLKDAGSALWGGAKAAGGDIANAWSGPQAQFQKAVGALQKLAQQVQQIAPDAVTTGDPSKGYPQMNLQQWLSDTVQELQNQAQQLPQRQRAQTTTNYQYGQPTPGGPPPAPGSKGV